MYCTGYGSDDSEAIFPLIQASLHGIVVSMGARLWAAGFPHGPHRQVIISNRGAHAMLLQKISRMCAAKVVHRLETGKSLWMESLNQAVPTKDRVRENYLDVVGRIQDSATRSGRTAQEVRLIGVTKSVDSKVARWLVEFGCLDLAESRPQI